MWKVFSSTLPLPLWLIMKTLYAFIVLKHAPWLSVNGGDDDEDDDIDSDVQALF